MAAQARPSLLEQASLAGEAFEGRIRACGDSKKHCSPTRIKRQQEAQAMQRAHKVHNSTPVLGATSLSAYPRLTTIITNTQSMLQANAIKVERSERWIIS